MNKKLAVLGFVLSAVLLWAVLRNVDIGTMTRMVMAIDGWYLGLSVLFFLFTIYFRAVRWRFLVAVDPPIPVTALFSATSIGLMVNNILPVRMGELVRAYLVGKKAKVSGVTALATLAVERIFDVLCLMAMLGFYLLAGNNEQVQRAGVRIALFGLLFLAILAGMIGFIYMASQRHQTIDKLVMRLVGRRFPGVSQQVLGVLSKAMAGFTSIRSIRQLLRILFFTLCLWSAGATSYYYLMQSFAFPFGFMSGLLVLVVVAFGAAFPSAPGAAGTFHAACVLGLSVVGLQDQSLAASYAFTLHATEWISSTALGFLFLWSEGLSLAAIRRQT